MKIMKSLSIIFVGMFLLAGCGGSLGSSLGLSSPSNYITASGTIVETTEEMAVIMATRDNNIARATSFNEAVYKSTKPEQVVALTAGYFGNQVQPITRSKTWDERLLPWAQGVFLPIWMTERAGAKSGKNGVSVEGDGNTVVYSEDTISGGGYKNTWITPISTVNKTNQIAAGSGVNYGTQKPCVASPAIIAADGTVTPATTCP